MAKKKKYIVTHSNYTVKKTHKKLDGNKTIYERDYTVLTNNGGWDSGTIAYGTPTFKMVNFIKPNEAKKHRYGNWLKQNVCVDNKQNGEIWTLECVPNNKPLDESKIEINANSNSLLDFAYYGSCSELIKTTINHIIETFPGEIFVTGKKYEEPKYKNGEIERGDDGEAIYETKNIYRVENPFDIDITSLGIPLNIKDNANKDRYFCESYFKYEILNINGKYLACVDKWEVTDHKRKACYNNGEYVCRVTINTATICEENAVTEIYFDVYYINDEYQIYCNVPNIRIRPTNGVIERFFSNLDDFEKIMLNRGTNPLYTMELDYPHETDFGIETYRKTFTWPTSNGYNLMLSGIDYRLYIDALLSLAEFYDEKRTNNLWRAMVHDSIKNMDLTYIGGNDVDIEDYNYGTSKIEGLFMAYGRQFDDLKRCIDNIKSSNIITYNGNNNTSSKFLSNKLELSGWEVNNVSPSIDNSNRIGKLFPGDRKEYSPSDANNNFMRWLQINSKDILSRKGTKMGVEMLLSLFGLKSYDFVNMYSMYCPEYLSDIPYDYKITEYVNVINGAPSIDKVEEYNKMKLNFEYESDESNSPTNLLQGLPVREVLYGVKNGDDIEERRYLIPWFSKFEEIDGSPYFQMYGGWGKIPSKRVDMFNTDELISTNENKIYEETCKYIKVVRKMSDLKKIVSTMKSGDIYYVSDISDFDSLYKNPSNNNAITLSGTDSLKASNYFILRNDDYSTILGESNDGTVIGWENIPEDDIKNAKNDGFKVLYIESIIDDNRGNNPHCGYGRYDDGTEYLRYFSQLFKANIDTDNFKEYAYDCESGELIDEIKTLGFSGLFDENGNVLYVKDNMKTWYFTDTMANFTNLSILNNIETDAKSGVSEMYGSSTNSSTVSFKNYVSDGEQGSVKIGVDSDYATFESDLKPHNIEGGENNDEAAANSIINNKKMVIEFSNNLFNDRESYDYLNNCILPYIKQMIPSTTILEIKIEGGLAEYTCMTNIAEIEGIS